MKKILLILAILVPLLASGQRMEPYLYNNYKYLSLYAYGLPREVVKTNAEMRASRTNSDGTGVMRRHHTSKGVDQAVTSGGYNGNLKLSFAFMIAPYNIDASGNHIVEGASDSGLTWSEASGWAADCSAVNPEPSGCAKYKGHAGLDDEGDWRLPTQRELQVMFTVIEQALGYIENEGVEGSIAGGSYWTSTEFDSQYSMNSASSDYVNSADHVWVINSITGETYHTTRDWTRCYVRCVKDIYEPINE